MQTFSFKTLRTPRIRFVPQRRRKKIEKNAPNPLAGLDAASRSAIINIGIFFIPRFRRAPFGDFLSLTFDARIAVSFLSLIKRRVDET